MNTVIGIDVGGSTTKIVGIRGRNIINTIKVKATDPVTSTYGAFGRFISENDIKLGDIDRIMITGVGASYIKENIYGVKTLTVNEFEAVGFGGLYLSGLDNAIVVSMGTGTAIVKASKDRVYHFGGTGVGGGTLLGLSNLMLNMRDFDNIIDLAKDGDLSKIDLTVGDITKSSVSTLLPKTTASNFGKISDLASKSDIALGIVNMVFQTIGMLAIFATKANGVKDVVLTGNLTTIPQLKGITENLQELYSVNFIIPDKAEFATSIGAALTLVDDKS